MVRGDISERTFMEVFITVSGSSISTQVDNLTDLTALIEDVNPGPRYVSATGWDAANDSPIIGTALNFGTGDINFVEKNNDYVVIPNDFSYDDTVK